MRPVNMQLIKLLHCMNSRFQTCIYHDEDTLTGNKCAGDKDTVMKTQCQW